MVDPRAFGWHAEAFVDLYCEGRMPADSIKRAVEGEPGVASAHTVAGEASALLHVMAEDTQDLELVPGANPRDRRDQPDRHGSGALDAVRALASTESGLRSSWSRRRGRAPSSVSLDLVGLAADGVGVAGALLVAEVWPPG